MARARNVEATISERMPKHHRDQLDLMLRRSIVVLSSGNRSFAPLHDRILVRRIQESETTRGGIVIPGNVSEKPREGEILAVGRGKVNSRGDVLPITLRVGQRVLFGKHAGQEIVIDGEQLDIMREGEVLAVIITAAEASGTSVTYRNLSLPGVRILPTLDRVLVQYEDFQSKTKGGLFIPQTAEIRKHGESYPAFVRSTGPGDWKMRLFEKQGVVERKPMSICPGDNIWAPCLNFPLYLEGAEVYLCREDALLGWAAGSLGSSMPRMQSWPRIKTPPNPE